MKREQILKQIKIKEMQMELLKKKIIRLEEEIEKDRKLLKENE